MKNTAKVTLIISSLFILFWGGVTSALGAGNSYMGCWAEGDGMAGGTSGGSCIYYRCCSFTAPGNINHLFWVESEQNGGQSPSPSPSVCQRYASTTLTITTISTGGKWSQATACSASTPLLNGASSGIIFGTDKPSSINTITGQTHPPISSSKKLDSNHGLSRPNSNCSYYPDENNPISQASCLNKSQQ
jgi:hypothetical protein